MTKKIILKGTYCIIIHLIRNTTIEVGKKGNITFNRGYYVYIGSALNSLESRLKRHLSSNKKLFWHIDYLLASSNAKIIDIVFAVDDGKWECHLALEIAKKGVEIRAFGCSDCKCSSHLYQFNEIEKAKKACVNAFKIIELEPKVLEDLELKN